MKSTHAARPFLIATLEGDLTFGISSRKIGAAFGQQTERSPSPELAAQNAAVLPLESSRPTLAPAFKSIQARFRHY